MWASFGLGLDLVGGCEVVVMLDLAENASRAEVTRLCGMAR